jgi:hypothetical protein
MIRGDDTKLMSFWRYRKIGDHLQRRALVLMLENALHVSAKSAENSARAQEKPALGSVKNGALALFVLVKLAKGKVT